MKRQPERSEGRASSSTSEDHVEPSRNGSLFTQSEILRLVQFFQLLDSWDRQRQHEEIM